MRKSLSLTFLVIAGLMLFSIASCGGSSDREQYAQTDYSYDYEEDAYDTYEETESVVTSFKAFPIYTDGRSPDNHYIPSGYMGDYSDMAIDASSFENPHSGSTCIKIVYTNASSQGARWVGLYWQNPANNWGDRKGGFDLTGATKLSFWAKGENGGERVEEFKVGGITGLYPDSDIAGIGPVLLSDEWKQYEIDLRGKDLSYISGGFALATNLDVNPEGAIFYLDDIRYE
ncbi:MAG: hypothetical protein KJ706_07770 [Candidatus Omnitrophica bacterium]|nr:hypothetical protein [Candidatus Omnitrophota bacterium]MBU4590699.1 hypothetical protein [Candidatus Omnitrophota bacterium]